LAAPPLEREPSYLEGDVGFVELFKEYEIGGVSEDETKEEEVVREDEEVVKQLEPRVEPGDLRRISNFTERIRGMHIFVRNFTYITDFLVVEDISSVIDHCLSQVVLEKPFVEVSNMNYDPSLGIVKFTNRIDEVAYQMPHKIEQFQSWSNMEKEHKQSVYFRNEEDKKEEWTT
ncbi:hypothetical protein Tco_0928052, partial [Tanacetum coccineum]